MLYANYRMPKSPLVQSAVCNPLMSLADIRATVDERRQQQIIQQLSLIFCRRTSSSPSTDIGQTSHSDTTIVSSIVLSAGMKSKFR